MNSDGKYRVMAVLIRGLAVGALIAVLGCTANQGNVEQASKAKQAVDSTPPSRVRVVELTGTPGEMGTEHGRKLGEEIRLLHKDYLVPLLADEAERKGALEAAAYFETLMLPEHREEISALAVASGVDHSETLLAQCFLDLSPMMGCSTIALPAGASPDGVARMGRNLDFPSLQVADKHSVLLIYHPQGHYAFAAVGWPGLIGVLSGMNERGLCLANMEVDREARAPSAMPYTLLYRMVLERCGTVDEAIALLQKTPRQTANNLMLMDAEGNRAVAEITPEGVVVRRGVDGAALISTNHQRGQDVDTAGRCWRYDRLHGEAAGEFGRIDTAGLEAMLRRVVQGDKGDMTMQSMVFEPSNLVIYLALGEDAPQRGYERIDLNNYFGKRGGIFEED